jgi:hypothetical protein
MNSGFFMQVSVYSKSVHSISLSNRGPRFVIPNHAAITCQKQGVVRDRA